MRELEEEEDGEKKRRRPAFDWDDAREGAAT
jgi:hypothetical protein